MLRELTKLLNMLAFEGAQVRPLDVAKESLPMPMTAKKKAKKKTTSKAAAKPKAAKKTKKK